MGESTLEWAKRQKVSASQTSRTNAVCEDCGRKWTATLTEVPVTIFIKDLDEYYKKLSKNLLEAVEPEMVLCVFRPSDRDVTDSEVTLSVVAPRQDSPYHWRINHKFSGPAAASGCQITIWKADQSSASISHEVCIEPDIVTIKQEIKEEMKEEDELMVEEVDFDPLARHRIDDPDDPDPDWTNSDTDTQLFKRFATASAADIIKIREDRHEAGTKHATKWAAKLFQEWYTEKVDSGDYDHLTWQTLSKELLNKILARFYVEVRRQDGKSYSKQAYISLRAGLQRHLNDGPWFVQYALVSDPAFKESNDTLHGVNKMLTKQGMDSVRHKPIDPKDIEKLKATNIIGTDNPLSLQRLVWFGISLHLGSKGREDYRKMTTKTFVISMDADGRRYMQQADSKTTKIKGYMISNRMYEQPGYEYCTLSAYELYLSLINADLECLWQRPNMKFKETGNWYHKQVIGRNLMGDFLKNMCKDAGITTVYTNHCTRVTTSGLLNEAGFGVKNITDVSGFESTSHLKKQKMPDIDHVSNKGPKTSKLDDPMEGPPDHMDGHSDDEIVQENLPITHSIFDTHLEEFNQAQI